MTRCDGEVLAIQHDSDGPDFCQDRPIRFRIEATHHQSRKSWILRVTPEVGLTRDDLQKCELEPAKPETWQHRYSFYLLNVVDTSTNSGRFHRTVHKFCRPSDYGGKPASKCKVKAGLQYMQVKKNQST